MDILNKTEELVKIAQNAEAFLRPIALAAFLGTVAAFCIYKAIQVLAIKPSIKCCQKVHCRLTKDKRKKAQLFEDMRQLTEFQIKEFFFKHYTYDQSHNFLIYTIKRHNKVPTEYSKNLIYILKAVCKEHTKTESNHE